MRAVVLAAVAATSLATAAQANLIVNGSFESPISGGSTTIVPGSEPSGFAWLVTTGNVEVQNNAFFGFPGAAYAGIQLLDLVGDGSVTTGAIAQTFLTTAGMSYSLKFAYANNPNGGAKSATIPVVNGINTLLSTSVTHSTSFDNRPVVKVRVRQFQICDSLKLLNIDPGWSRVLSTSKSPRRTFTTGLML